MTRGIALIGLESVDLVSDQTLWDDIFSVMASASIGDFSSRVKVAEDADLTNMVVKFALAVNLLLDDLAANQEHRVHELAEEAIVQSIESRGLIEEARVLMREYVKSVERNKYHK